MAVVRTNTANSSTRVFLIGSCSGPNISTPSPALAPFFTDQSSDCAP